VPPASEVPAKRNPSQRRTGRSSRPAHARARSNEAPPSPQHGTRKLPGGYL
jgi:hypothetical protein